MPLSPTERKAALVTARVSQARIARTLGITQAHVSQVLTGERRSARVEAAIAIAIGLTVEEVFGPPARTHAKRVAA